MTAPKGANTTSDGRTYPVQGRNLPSASTLTKHLANRGLETWKLKKVARGVAVDPYIRQLAEDEQSLYRAVRQCLDSSSPESELGDAVHTATELYDLEGRTVAPDPRAQAHLEQWIAVRDTYWLDPYRVEQTVANLDDGYAGTFDREMVTRDPYVADMIHEGCRLPHVLDIKTGSLHGSVSMQIAGYAYAPHLWNPDTDELTPHDDVCREWGLVAHLKADRCNLVPVYLVDGWNAFRACKALQDWAEVESFVLADALPELEGALPW